MLGIECGDHIGEPSPSGLTGSGITRHPCDPDPDLDCTDVPVPVDWSNPDGDQLTFAVIRHRASKPGPADRHHPGRSRRPR